MAMIFALRQNWRTRFFPGANRAPYSGRSRFLGILATLAGSAVFLGAVEVQAGWLQQWFSAGPNDEISRMVADQQKACDSAERIYQRALKRLQNAKADKAEVAKELAAISNELKQLQAKLATEKDAAKRRRLLKRITALDSKSAGAAKRAEKAQQELVNARRALAQAEKNKRTAEAVLEQAKTAAAKKVAAQRKLAEERRKKAEKARQARERILAENKKAQRELRKAEKAYRHALARQTDAAADRDKAFRQWEQAQAVARQRRNDVARAKNPEARAKAQAALSKAERYAWERQEQWRKADEKARAAQASAAKRRQALEQAKKQAQAAADAVAELKGKPRKVIRVPLLEPRKQLKKTRHSKKSVKRAAASKKSVRKRKKAGGLFAHWFSHKKKAPKSTSRKSRPKQVRKKSAPHPVPKRSAPARKTRRRKSRVQKPTPKPAPRPKPVLIPVKRIHQENVSEPAPWAVPAQPQLPILPAEKKLSTPGSAGKTAAAGAATKTIQFDIAMVSGDKEIVEKLKVWKQWADYIPFNPVTIKEINDFYGKLVKALQEQGYVFAKVVFPTRIWSTGIFLAKVDCGPLGAIVVRGNRHYSAKQIIRALQRQEGERFNYARIYSDIFNLNTKPDLKIDTKLKPVIQDGRRVINAELDVRDRLPLHAAFEASNTGTKDTNDWRFRTTVQHLNLTKHDDILTVDWLTSPDWHDVNAYSGSYFLPLGRKYSLNLYGGYSKSNINDVMPQLDIRGEGLFYGGQITRTLRETLKSRWQLSLGWLFQHTDTHHDVSGTTMVHRQYDVSMPSITLGYASRVFDRLAGRNFFSNTIMANFGGNFGSSSSAEFNALGAGNSRGTFVIDRFQIARLQHFFRGEETPGKWSLFLKVEGQLASDTLVPELRKSVGGANTVRGYAEDDEAGDQAVVATLELRTPLLQNFIPGLKKSDKFLAENPDAWQRHRLQFLLFTDVGYVDMKNPLPGEQDRDMLIGVGAGLRLGLTKYSQLRLDIGYPLEKTEESDNVRAHLSLQLQF